MSKNKLLKIYKDTFPYTPVKKAQLSNICFRAKEFCKAEYQVNAEIKLETFDELCDCFKSQNKWNLAICLCLYKIENIKNKEAKKFMRNHKQLIYKLKQMKNKL